MGDLPNGASRLRPDRVQSSLFSSRGLSERSSRFSDSQHAAFGHQEITDAYLLALATHHRGKLATLDKGVLAWESESAVELIG